jgi:hypothetical protein
MRTIRRIHTARYHTIEDLISFSPLPSPSLPHLNPFLTFRHYGPQRYIPDNNGLPFVPSAYHSSEVITYILAGDVIHSDSIGNNNLISAGGVHWTTAGRGIIHSEVSSEEFKEKGGYLEILQLFINLPLKYRMLEPEYKGIEKHQIPVIRLNEKVNLDLIAGRWNDLSGPIESCTGIFTAKITMAPQSKFDLYIPTEHAIFFYVIKGSLVVNKEKVNKKNMVEFAFDDDQLQIASDQGSMFLLAHAVPHEDPLYSEESSVIETEKILKQAYLGYFSVRMRPI